MDVSANANTASQALGITNADVPGHQASLREPEEKRVLGGKAIRFEVTEEFEEEASTSDHPGSDIALKIIPGKSAEIIVGGIDEGVAEPWKLKGRGEPAVAFNTVPEPMEHDDQ